MKTAMPKKTATTKKKPRAAAGSRKHVYWKGKASAKKRGAALDLKIAAADFERPVIYRGIKIEPIVGRPSALSRAVRDDLRKQFGQSRR